MRSVCKQFQLLLYLVVGESPGQTKRDDAEDNEVPIIDEDEFQELLGEYGIDLE